MNNPPMERNALIALVEKLEHKGGFACAIGKAMLLADNENLQKLITAFPEYCREPKAILRIVK